VLGNQIDISWAVIKDSISMGYNLTILVGAAIFAYKIQDIGKGRPAQAENPRRCRPTVVRWCAGVNPDGQRRRRNAPDPG
jgi:hypothetical protein